MKKSANWSDCENFLQCDLQEVKVGIQWYSRQMAILNRTLGPNVILCVQQEEIILVMRRLWHSQVVQPP